METMIAPAPRRRATSPLADDALVARVLAGEGALFEVVMRRHNAKVYRAVRALLRDEAEVEDAMQQAYLAAYANLSQFQGGSLLSTWLVRIAVNEALMRLRKGRRLAALETPDSPGLEDRVRVDEAESPEDRASAREGARLLGSALEELPPLYRVAFVLREAEGMPTAEVAAALSVSEAVVKTRLHRAKAMLRKALMAKIGEQATALYPFEAPRCDRVVGAVMAALFPES